VLAVVPATVATAPSVPVVPSVPSASAVPVESPASALAQMSRDANRNAADREIVTCETFIGVRLSVDIKI
jgi:hypothetical protein